MGHVQITRFGHAAVLVEAADSRILIDPGVFSSAEAFELEGLDAVVVTHQHPDHIDVTRGPRLLDRNPEAVLIADPESAGMLEFGDWIRNADGLGTAIGAVTIRGVGSQHAAILPALPRVANVGVVLTAAGEPTLFHPGDTYEYAPQGIDVLALPLSAPWAKISETVDFVQRVSPGSLFPIHDKTISELAYGIYWQHTVNFGGVEDSRKLGQTDSDTFASA